MGPKKSGFQWLAAGAAALPCMLGVVEWGFNSLSGV